MRTCVLLCTQANPDGGWTRATKASMNFNRLAQIPMNFHHLFNVLVAASGIHKNLIEMIAGQGAVAKIQIKALPTRVCAVGPLYIFILFLLFCEALLIKIGFMWRPRWAKLLGNVFGPLKMPKTLMPRPPPSFLTPHTASCYYLIFMPQRFWRRNLRLDNLPTSRKHGNEKCLLNEICHCYLHFILNIKDIF